MGTQIYTIIILSLLVSMAQCGFEPRCSRFDFEERTLEKLVRLEHKMELQTETLEKMKKELEERQDKLEEDKTRAIEELTRARDDLVNRIEEITS